MIKGVKLVTFMLILPQARHFLELRGRSARPRSFPLNFTPETILFVLKCILEMKFNFYHRSVKKYSTDFTIFLFKITTLFNEETN